MNRPEFLQAILALFCGISGALASEGIDRLNRVEQIYITGNSLVKDNEILRVIKSKKGEVFDGETWEEDRERLKKTGLFSEVWTGTPSAKSPGSGVLLLIDLVENPIVERISLSGGLGAEIRSDVAEEFSRHHGKILVDGDLEKLSKYVKEKLQERVGVEAVVKAETITISTVDHKFLGMTRKVVDRIEVIISIVRATNRFGGSIPGASLIVVPIEPSSAPMATKPVDSALGMSSRNSGINSATPLAATMLDDQNEQETPQPPSAPNRP